MCVLDRLPPPGVRDVHQAVQTLDNGGVGVLALAILEHHGLPPRPTVLRYRDRQCAAAARSRVGDEEETAVGQPHGVDTRARIGQRGRRHRPPGTPAVGRPGFGDHTLPAATEDLQLGRRVHEDRGLNRGKLVRVVQRPSPYPATVGDEGLPPSLFRSALGREPFHVRHPSVVLGARPREECARAELDRLRADRSEDPVRQCHRLRPGPAAVGRGAHQTPPLAWIGTGLVEEQQGAARRPKQHRVPAGMTTAVGLQSVRHLDRVGPARPVVTRQPDTDIGLALRRAAKPGRHEPVRRRRHRRRMCRRKRRVLKDKRRRDQRSRSLRGA